MKNKLIALVLCALMLLSVAAVAGAVTEITIPSYKTGENVGAVFFVPQVERFNAKYDGVYKINLETAPQDNFNDRLKQLAQQNALPVLIQGGDPEWIRNVVIPRGQAYDMTEWIESTPDLKALFLEDSLDYCTIDGKINVIPLATIRGTGLYYNSELWNPGDISRMTMDEFIEALGDQKIAFSTLENGWVAGLMFTALINAEEGGAELLNTGINPDTRIVDFNNDVFINAATKLQQLLQNNAAPNSIGAAYADAANNFMSNQAAVIANGPWMATDFSEANAENWSNGFDGANVHAAFFPGQMGIASARAFGEWWISANASEEEIELAKAFIEFVYSPEELEAFLLAEGGDAPNLTYSDGFKAEQAKTQVLADLAEDATADSVFVPCFLDAVPNSTANMDFGRLLPGLADGSLTPEQFCQQLTISAQEATME